MPLLVLAAIAAILLAAGLLLRPVLRRRARTRLRLRPLPADWREALDRNFPLYGRLSPAERQRLHGHVHVFLAEKSFEGCGGLDLTDEIRVTVAAQACLLLLNLDDADYYPRLRSILVYPSTMMPRSAREPVHGTLSTPDGPILGQSWGHGTVILAWDSVRRGAAALDGRNVVFHEFAHQLDQEDGTADGTPYLDDFSAFRTWGRVMQEHHAALRKAVKGGRPTVLDEYGAVNPAEFFAVATECFFEKPLPLQRKHPALYEELSAYYGLDPAAWKPAG